MKGFFPGAKGTKAGLWLGERRAEVPEKKLCNPKGTSRDVVRGNKTKLVVPGKPYLWGQGLLLESNGQECGPTENRSAGEHPITLGQVGQQS